jgi:anti-anti-sigma factor
MNAEPMVMDETMRDDVVVLRLHGMLANRPNMTAFYQRLTQLQQAGHTRIVVDFSGVQGCGAALLGWLISGQQSLRKAGGDLCLTGVSERMRRILKLTRLAEQFSIFGTTEHAVAMLHGMRKLRAA